MILTSAMFILLSHGVFILYRERTASEIPWNSWENTSLILHARKDPLTTRMADDFIWKESKGRKEPRDVTDRDDGQRLMITLRYMWIITHYAVSRRSNSLCYHWLLRADRLKCMFAISLVYLLYNSIFCIEPGIVVDVVRVTIHLSELNFSLSLVSDCSFMSRMFQSFFKNIE